MAIKVDPQWERDKDGKFTLVGTSLVLCADDDPHRLRPVKIVKTKAKPTKEKSS